MKNHMLEIEHGRKVRNLTIVHHYQTLLPFAKCCKEPFSKLNKMDIYDYCAFLERKGYELNGKRREYAEASIFAYKASIKNLLKNINSEAFHKQGYKSSSQE